MKAQFHTFQMPRWLGPLLVLIILALIPFALMLAASLTVLAVGFSIFRLFLPSTSRPAFDGRSVKSSGKNIQDLESSAIDADYEIKDKDAKS